MNPGRGAWDQTGGLGGKNREGVYACSNEAWEATVTGRAREDELKEAQLWKAQSSPWITGTGRSVATGTMVGMRCPPLGLRS